MSWKCEKVNESLLRPATEEEQYALHLAALEWSLAETIIIQSAEDIQSRANWRDPDFKPFHHQVQNLFTFCRRLPVTLLADDVGLGKTISAGLILSELMARRRVRRALVLCPKILCEQWKEELAAKFGLTSIIPKSKKLVAKEMMKRENPVVITTYESVREQLEKVPADAFDLLILDEAHKLRNLHGWRRKPPAIATSVRKALEERRFKYVVMLTATPIHNSLWDIYSLTDCLTAARGHRNPLGTPEEFQGKYLLRGKAGRQLIKEHAETFQGILREYIVRTRRDDAKLKFPTREIRQFCVQASEQEKRLTAFVGKQIGKLNPLQQTSLSQALMSSPQALLTQLENSENGTLPNATATLTEARQLASQIAQPTKLIKLLYFLNELRAERPDDWRAVVFTTRKETQELIGQTLQQAEITVGFIRGGASAQNHQAINQFRMKRPGVRVLVSTDAGAEGINLQVANVLVNYDLPWNPMVVEQRIGRLQRLRSEHEKVVVCNLVVAGSVEERIVARLMEKLQTISNAIGDIESILESVYAKDGGGGEAEGFEKQIRELVVKSLLGLDMEKAIRLAEESIQKAQKQIEERRHEIDSTLGKLDAPHDTGPSMPKLVRKPPGMSAEDFVIGAKRAEGAQVTRRPDGIFEASNPYGQRELITFDEDTAEAANAQAVFQGSVDLYQPGRQKFGELVNKWVDFYGLFVRDLRQDTQDKAERLARSWCDTVPGATLLSWEVVAPQSRFQGQAHVKIRAINGLDSYEKLISQEFCPEGHPTIREVANAGVLREDTKPSDLLPDYLDPLKQAVESDEDINKFCSFYEARRQEEIGKAEDERRRHKIHSDFTPSVVGQVVGVQGTLYDEVAIKVRFTLEGSSPYEVTLDAIPAADHILREQPPRERCGDTGVSVPQNCLARCTVSGLNVLRHLLVKSEISENLALPRYVVECDRTGQKVLENESAICAISQKRLLRDETGQSCVSGKVVDRAYLVPSDRSGRLALEGELECCEETRARLLPDEVGLCAVTHRWVDRRLLATSEVSGATALATRLRRCARTGKLALPSELEQCELTLEWVLPELLGVCAVTGKRVSRAELVTCQKSGATILRSEVGKSACSGKQVRKDLLVASQKHPGRQGLQEEGRLCEVSGKWLLLDELEWSEVSGKPGDRDLLRRCARTGKLALPSELKQCQVTRAWVLPGELETCAVTGQRVLRELTFVCQETGVRVLNAEKGTSDYSGNIVRRDLLRASEKPPGRLGLQGEFAQCQVTRKRLLLNELGRSEVSNTLVDRDLLHQCSRSGKRALKSELETCGLTKALALPEFMETCAVTETRALRDELLTSSVSGKYVIPSKALRSAISGKVCLPMCKAIPKGEAVRCPWMGRPVLRSEVRGCKLTRNVVAEHLLNKDGELEPLRRLLDGRHRDAVARDDLIPVLRSLDEKAFNGLRHVWVVEPGGGDTLAVCAEVRTGLFISKTRYVGLLLRLGNEPKSLGYSVIGYRTKAGWFEESE